MGLTSPAWRRCCFRQPQLYRVPSLVNSASRTGFRRMSTKSGEESQYQHLKVSKSRLMDDIHSSAQWGTGKRWGSGTTETGMSRLSLSDADREVRDWFVEAVKPLGCKVTVDSMGNIFAVRPGRKDGPPTCIGSHFDTQPAGGRYDGVLGVLAGLESLRVLHDHGIETEYPVGIINWTNEEGARFPVSMLSSGVWAGEIPLSKAHDLKEVGKGTATVKSELERIGYLGSTLASHESMPIAAHFELHIEQGPILEAEKRKVGVVQGVQAYKWYTIEVQGRDSHTGTTSLEHRADALLAAAKMILHSNRTATSLGGLASTGLLSLTPGSTNTIPGSVTFSLDIRAKEDSIVEAMESELKQSFSRIASGADVGGLNQGTTPSRPCTVSWRTDSVSPAVQFHPDCIKCVREAAAQVLDDADGNLTRDITSGAGHDSVYTSKRVPTTMIFVTSKDGISHNPVEYTSPEDCAIGAEVLLHAVLKYDQLRASKTS